MIIFFEVRMWKPRFAQAHACFRHQREEANKVGQFSQKQFIDMMAATLYFQLKDFYEHF